MHVDMSVEVVERDPDAPPVHGGVGGFTFGWTKFGFEAVEDGETIFIPNKKLVDGDGKRLVGDALTAAIAEGIQSAAKVKSKRSR